MNLINKIRYSVFFLKLELVSFTTVNYLVDNFSDSFEVFEVFILYTKTNRSITSSLEDCGLWCF